MGSTKSDPISNSAKNNGKPYGNVVITLKNQLLSEGKLSPTPSQIDGLGIDTETDLRIYGCELIQTAGILLKLPQVAMATGQVLLQRFYYSKSLVRHPVDHTAMACVCLASKIEEAPRRVRDVINVFTHIRQVNSNKGSHMALKGLCVKNLHEAEWNLKKPPDMNTTRIKPSSSINDGCGERYTLSATFFGFLSSFYY